MSKRRTTTGTRARKPTRTRSKLGDLRIDLGRWDADAATNATTGADCGLGAFHHICPGCRVRVAWRPRSREDVARRLRQATDALRVAGASRSQLDALERGVFVDLLGICAACVDRLASGEPLIAPGVGPAERVAPPERSSKAA